MVLEAIRFARRKDSREPSASLEILDQLLLPHRTSYFRISTCEDAHHAIKQMQVRGAPAIAIVAALALATELTQADSESVQIPDSVERTADLIGTRLDYLKTSRPTAVNLSDAVGKLKKVADQAATAANATPASVVEAYVNAAERMLVDDVSDNKAIGEHGAAWIEHNTTAGVQRSKDPKQGLQVLTHCNTGSLATAGYGTALGVIRSLRSRDMLTHAYCSETRPYNQGSRLTAYELVHDQIPATLITDSMAASLLAREGTSLAAIVVGADRVAANGDTANKIGTYSLAVLARHHGVKFLVAAPRTTIDLSTPSGDQIVIEQRAADEVTKIKGPRISAVGQILIDEEPATINVAATGIDVWNPAFDITPAALIDGVITECGVVEKSDGRFDFQSLFTGH
ncbi:S-methyl-5-thioribose-1-phosphate isomerase [Cyphellophora europaea CBS 101466]|uniref:Methylthioribose-1-phosphate isomerase n=1 Tax=Cyphellophora europaea (strain CBS 101466) TaxID=1220924 RepID=W2RQT6_CYPE1|nr:S-methyl-5-thioribose-1-phosphate isomerase [Cyphellophora europaea CBS 101466]ETN38822.1 S-methyl-5-thioribose-1-phosphate isomerase [Cyphellophora europaea CBS 101466]